jgi:hypothetical protein
LRAGDRAAHAFVSQLKAKPFTQLSAGFTYAIGAVLIAKSGLIAPPPPIDREATHSIAGKRCFELE